MPQGKSPPFDVLILGGSYAGIAAALQLARARRRVLVVDAGLRRNRFAAAAHGVPGWVGAKPGRIAEIAREQLLRYPTIAWRNGSAVEAAREDGGFAARLASGETFRGRKLILATGVSDELPPVPGLAEGWGRTVFHCPYCHGYELNPGALGVLAVGGISLHQALLVPEWGPTTLFLNGTFAPDAEAEGKLRARGVAIERDRVVEVRGLEAPEVRLAGGRSVPLAGLFVAPRQRLSPIASGLGCAVEEGPLGAFVQTNGLQETSVPGVFACGDAARGAGNVTLAMAEGNMAGSSAHRSLIFG